MLKFIIDENTIWEDTGRIIVHNFPPKGKTVSYITRVYREFKKGEFGHKEVEGSHIHFESLSNSEVALAIVIGTAQMSLSTNLPYEESAKLIDNSFQ